MKKLILLGFLSLMGKVLAEEVYVAHYDLYWGNIKAGTVERRLTKDANTYSFSSVARPVGLAKFFIKGIVEKSKFSVKGNRVLSSEYFYDQKGKKNRKVRHKYKWDNRSLEILEPKKLSINNFAGNAIDFLSFQHHVPLGLAAGKNSFTGSVYKKSPKADVYNLKKTGSENVETPAGKYDAIKVSRTGDTKGKSFNVWCAKELNFLPVKIEYTTRKGDLWRMILTKIKQK